MVQKEIHLKENLNNCFSICALNEIELMKHFPRASYPEDYKKCNLLFSPKMVLLILAIIGLSAFSKVMAQETQNRSGDSSELTSPTQKPVATTGRYPRITAYMGFAVPMITFSNTTTTNFNGSTSIEFPVGINILYNEKFGFSYTVTPEIKITKGSSKMNDLLFDPGPMFRLKHGYTIITRAAFNTNGRYGFTPVLNKTFLYTKVVNYYASVGAPVRFGNSEAASVGLNLQFGFIFN